MDGSTLVFLCALYLYGVSLLLIRVVRGQWSVFKEPITWFYASWLLGLLMLALPMYQYYESFSLDSAGFLFATLGFFSVGALAASFWGRRRDVQRRMAAEMPRLSAVVSFKLPLLLLVLGLGGSALLLLNSLLGGDLSLIDRLDADNLSEVRAAHMEVGRSQIGRLYGIANLASAIGGAGIAMVFYMRGARQLGVGAGAQLFWLAQLALLFNFSIGLVGFGSRMFAVFSVMVAFLGFMQGRWSIGESVLLRRISFRSLLVSSLSIVVTIATLYGAATVFLERRVQSQDPQTLLFRTHRATFAPLAYEATRGDKTAQYLLLSLSYFTVPVATLTYYSQLPSARTPGPFFGEYNFPAIARWLRRLTFTGDPFAWERARYDIFKPLADINFGTNVWSTLVRDLIADFTKGGALIFLLVLGFVTQRLHELQQAYPEVRRAVLLVYLRLIIAFAGLVSILFMPQIHWPLYLAVLLVLWRPGRKLRGMPGVLGKSPVRVT